MYSYLSVCLFVTQKVSRSGCIQVTLSLSVFGYASLVAWGDKIEKNEMGWACGAYG